MTIFHIFYHFFALVGATSILGSIGIMAWAGICGMADSIKEMRENRLNKINSKLLLIAMFLFPASVRAENLSSLISDARTLVVDSNSSRQRFSDSQITGFINQGSRLMISQTHCLMASATIQLTVGTTYYSLPSNFTAIRRVVRGNYGAMLEQTPAGMDGKSRGWESASGSPVYYFVNFSTRGKIGFAPFPATVADTDTVRVDLDIDTNDLSASTDIPFYGINELTGFHHYLAYYAAAMMSTIDDQFTPAKMFFDMYSSVIPLLQKRCEDRPSYLPSATSTP